MTNNLRASMEYSLFKVDPIQTVAPGPSGPVAAATQITQITTNITNSDVGYKESAGTNVFPGRSNSSNAVGLVGPSYYAITTPPYHLSSCDQVLLIEAQRIIEMRDYSTKAKAFFTLSMYLINVFEEKNADKLVDSLSMDKITTLPYVIQGAPKCVNFQGVAQNKTSKNIAMCFDNEEFTGQIIEVYKDLLTCRSGGKILTYAEMKKIVEQCQLSNQGAAAGMTPGAVTTTSNVPGLVNGVSNTNNVQTQVKQMVVN
jgi:hypothetical protein